VRVQVSVTAPAGAARVVIIIFIPATAQAVVIIFVPATSGAVVIIFFPAPTRTVIVFLIPPAEGTAILVGTAATGLIGVLIVRFIGRILDGRSIERWPGLESDRMVQLRRDTQAWRFLRLGLEHRLANGTFDVLAHCLRRHLELAGTGGATDCLQGVHGVKSLFTPRSEMH
jgi:hypothetical protein